MHRDPLIRSFDRLVARRPGRPIVVSPDAPATAGEIAALARSLGERLDAAALLGGAPIGLAAPNGAAFLAGLVACLRTGHPPVLIDALATDAESGAALERLSACAMLDGRAAAGTPAGEAGGATRDGGLRLVPREGGRPLDAGLGGAVIKLTSGSTGEPRGILTPTEALLADDAALVGSMGIGDDDRLLAVVPMSHSYGLSSLAVPALVRGIALVVPARGGRPASFAAAARGGATVLPTAPALLAGIVRLAEPPPLPPTVRLIISAGARLLPETAARFRQRYGLGVHAFYGASECGGIAYDREGTAAERGEIGPPVDGVSVELERGPDGASDQGRIVVRSPAVARTYLPQPDPRLGGGRFLTDDLGRWRDGRLELIGRLGETINVRGRKVHPAEVERVIGGLDAVSEVRVVGVAREGSGDESVHAVVAAHDPGITPEAIVRWCRGRLAEHKIPRRIVIVDRLPRTARGKPDRRALESLAGTAAHDDPARG